MTSFLYSERRTEISCVYKLYTCQEKIGVRLVELLLVVYSTHVLAIPIGGVTSSVHGISPPLEAS
jgi:hypothetical protein